MTARPDSTQEMATESARQAAKAHMVEMAESKCTAVNERNLDSKVANLTSRFQCGQSGEELENRFAELSARSEARQQILSNESALMDAHTRNPGKCGVLEGFNFKTGDHVGHFSVKHNTRGILQGCLVRADGAVQADVKQNRSCLGQTVWRNLAQFTG